MASLLTWLVSGGASSGEGSAKSGVQLAPLVASSLRPDTQGRRGRYEKPVGEVGHPNCALDPGWTLAGWSFFTRRERPHMPAGHYR